MKCNRSVLCFLLLLLQYLGNGQDFSNKGKDFWLGYGYHVSMPGNNSQNMVLYFTSDKNATVAVDIPGIGYKKTYAVIANQVTVSDSILKAGTQDARIFTYGIFDRGIHITSDVGIVAYAHIYNAAVSGASLLFPTNTLGKDYYSVNFTQSANSTNANSFFFVVATEDNTAIEITPSAANLNGLAVGKPSNPIFLNKGQIYSVMGTTAGTVGTDLTGSRIRSISTNGNNGCNKIAVFSGSGKISIGGFANGSSDNLFAQAFPAVAWGKKYLTAPTGSQPNNFYRVCVTDPNTVVKLNGVVLPASSLTNGFFYQFKNSNEAGNNSPVPNLIESDKPVLVAQYCTTQGQEGNPASGAGGDPEMIYLSPVEQTINNITLYSATKYSILQSYINVIVRNGGVASFTLDGISRASNFSVHPRDSAYSYAIMTVSPGSHTLYSDTGFNAIAYGFGQYESYGYNAGTNIRDFTPVAAFQNPFGRIDAAVTCVNTAFQFSVPLSFVPTSLQWDFSAAAGSLLPNANIGPLTGVIADSTPTINGRTLNYYSTGKTYLFTKANTSIVRDTIKLYTTSATPDGCGSSSQVFIIPVTVNVLPTAKFITGTVACIADSVQFTDQSISNGGTLKKWVWDFGDGTRADLTSSSVQPKLYTVDGSKTIKLQVASDIGCISEPYSLSILQTARPVAKFTLPAIACQDMAISFTDASTSSTGALAKWIWNLDDGTGPFTNTNNTSPKTQYAVSGIKNITLQVETGTGCKSEVFAPATPLKINPLPVVGFILPEVCLNDANAQFTDTSFISEGSLSSYYWNLNAGSPAITPAPNMPSSTLKNPVVKYNKSDNYKVSLIVTSNKGCVAEKTQNFTVNGSTPKAAFEIINTAPYCGTKPVLLKNNSTVDFGNLTRLEIFWDFVNNPSVKEVDETPTPGKIYPHSYPDLQLPASQRYTIKLIAYSGGTTCVDGTSKTITVFPQPKADFSLSARQICSGDTISFLDKSKGISSLPVKWVWDLGKGDLPTVQNPKKQFNDSGMISVSMYFFNGDGCVSDTISSGLTVYPNPQLILPHKAQVLIEGKIKIKPQLVYGHELQYLWTPATYLNSDTSASPIAIPLDDITYKLVLTGIGGCSVSDTIFIKVLKGPEVPNAFSPNGDGINDTWKIKYLEGYPGATVEIYNRYGQIVYKSQGYDVEWNGSYLGNPLPIGTYYYIINPKNGREIIKGSVTIIK